MEKKNGNVVLFRRRGIEPPSNDVLLSRRIVSITAAPPGWKSYFLHEEKEDVSYAPVALWVLVEDTQNSSLRWITSFSAPDLEENLAFLDSDFPNHVGYAFEPPTTIQE